MVAYHSASGELRKRDDEQRGLRCQVFREGLLFAFDPCPSVSRLPAKMMGKDGIFVFGRNSDVFVRNQLDSIQLSMFLK
ncbi:MAG: hypothetical protein CMO55_18060 [Verrucomicrobiales bacterium]|nr:hypothetical protein [Verrucomicrobiales bacterium]